MKSAGSHQDGDRDKRVNVKAMCTTNQQNRKMIMPNDLLYRRKLHPIVAANPSEKIAPKTSSGLCPYDSEIQNAAMVSRIREMLQPTSKALSKAH